MSKNTYFENLAIRASMSTLWNHLNKLIRALENPDLDLSHRQAEALIHCKGYIDYVFHSYLGKDFTGTIWERIPTNHLFYSLRIKYGEKNESIITEKMLYIFGAMKVLDSMRQTQSMIRRKLFFKETSEVIDILKDLRTEINQEYRIDLQAL